MTPLELAASRLVHARDRLYLLKEERSTMDCIRQQHDYVGGNWHSYPCWKREEYAGPFGETRPLPRHRWCRICQLREPITAEVRKATAEVAAAWRVLRLRLRQAEEHRCTALVRLCQGCGEREAAEGALCFPCSGLQQLMSGELF